VERAGARNGSKGTPPRAARLRNRPHPSAVANTSRHCAPKSPQTPRPRASASSAARLRTARGGPSRSSACHGLSKTPRTPRPKRGRNAADVRTLGNAADVRSSLAAAPVGATPSGPSGGEPAEGASGRRVRTIRRVGVGPRGQSPGGLTAARGSAASTALQREVMAIVEMARRERGALAIRRASASLIGPRGRRMIGPVRADRLDRLPTLAARLVSAASTVPRRKTAIVESVQRAYGMAPIRRANESLTGLKAACVPQPARADRRDRTLGAAGRASAASMVPQRSGTASAETGRHERGAPAIPRANENLIGLRAGRVPQPARVGRRDLRTRAAARAQTSNQDRRAQERVTEIGSRALAVARAAKADRRAVAPHHQGGALPRGKDRREEPAAYAGHRGSRDRCESSAAASRAACC
jgi:hypothetical protein